MPLRDYLASLIRTFVPIAVGLVLARLGINAVEVEGIALQTVVSVLVVTGYYAGARALELKWRWFGVLLGLAVTPLYPPMQPTTGISGSADGVERNYNLDGSSGWKS